MAALLRFGSMGMEVRFVQEALNRLVPLPPPLVLDGIFGPKTQARVIEFQRRKGLVPDGVVGPKTSALLMPGPGGRFNNFTDLQVGIILSDLDLARRMLDEVNSALVTIPQVIAKTSNALYNVFDINLSESETNPFFHAMELTKLSVLVLKFRRLRVGLDEAFPFTYEGPGTYAAWVVGTGLTADPTVHITQRYYEIGNQLERAVTLIHERAHTLCQPPQDIVHPGTADVPAGHIHPHEDKVKEYVFERRPFHHEAIRNPWCFEWFTLAVQRSYNRNWFCDRGCESE